ncbi:uracil-DNA glycosylase family protein [Litorimonas cladophorae]|uniref:uracil-DNA glycosylase family protein n=1 Tax=Litorimonas cladophorae TaxID=1220491 RepID=UPI0016753990|nr:uracil-DNA glycosylase family protein [Litorimonas cladophorae]
MSDINCQLKPLLSNIRGCQVCASATPPLPVNPNPILQASAQSKIRIIGQAPGTLAHASSQPFTDPSGVRLREWLGVDEPTFYDADKFAITPMGFCFPGQDNKGGDLPPRPECAPLWQEQLDQALPNVQLTLVVGMYAVKWHLGHHGYRNLTDTVRHWRDLGPSIMPLPHPSWRNNGWIKRHDWFAEELIALKARVASILQ